MYYAAAPNHRRWKRSLSLTAASLLIGCQRSEVAVSPPPPPEVQVVRPTRQEFTDYEEFSGHMWARDNVDIKARVSGYLDEAPFKDGEDVKKGDLLFRVDPRSYRSEVDRMAAAMEQTQSRLARLEIQLGRAKRLIADAAVSQEEVDILQSDRNEADAAHKAAQANLAMARLDLEFTEIRAPLDGRMSRRLVDPGNLVQADQTLLATLVSTNPIDVYFDVDERTVLRLRRLQETSANLQENGVEVSLSLADKADYSIRGVVDFIDNRLDPNTGTLRMRAKVNNDQQLLSPGMFVRCRYPIGEPRQALFVPENALGSDQGRSFLYVLDANDQVQYRRVALGPLVDGRRVVLDNLSADERVIVAGLQRVRPGIKVAPKPAEDERSAANVADSGPVKATN